MVFGINLESAVDHDTQNINGDFSGIRSKHEAKDDNSSAANFSSVTFVSKTDNALKVELTEETELDKINEKFREIMFIMDCEELSKSPNMFDAQAVNDKIHQLNLIGASNGEIVQFLDDLEEQKRKCLEVLGGRSAHDMSMDLYISGDVRGLLYISTHVLPLDFENYSSEEKTHYHLTIGGLISKEVEECDLNAITVYKNGYGYGTHWILNEDPITYELKKLALHNLKNLSGDVDELISAAMSGTTMKIEEQKRVSLLNSIKKIYKNCKDKDIYK